MNPTELLKKLHPEQFSDSVIVDKVENPGELLDYYLSNLAEKNRHFDFEEYIRKLLEREVCPNLIKETGPAAGGDGKVDTENYPAAKHLQDYWWYGINENNEKWAVAISLRKDWRTKCNQDIANIIITNRGYTKIFFVTNQSVKSDKRVEYQKEKGKETGLEIIIFDKSWILDKALKDSNLDLLEIIGMKKTLRERIIGPKDLIKERQLAEIEKKLQDYASKDIINQDVVDLAIESAYLSEELEHDEVTIVGKYNRALKLAKKKNNKSAQRKILYDLAWYYHWRLNDDENFNKYYEEYQSSVIRDDVAKDIINLVNLWILSFARSITNKISIDDKTNMLLKLLNEKEQNSKSKAIKLEISSRICIIKLYLNIDVDEQFTKLISIVNESTKYKEYDFNTLAKMLKTFLPIYNDNEKYDELYELITEKIASRESEIKRAEMYLDKSIVLTERKEYYNAINILGKCLTLLYKEESSDKLLEAYIKIGVNFTQIGLFYAAKNYYIAAIALFIEILLEEGELNPVALKIINIIIDMEIKFGNVELAIKWVNIKNIILNILIDKNREYEQDDGDITREDVLIAELILRTKYEDFNIIDKIIYECSNNGLDTSEHIARYVLGDYSKELLEESNDNKDDVDKKILEFYQASLKNKIPNPIYYNGKKSSIISKLCGSKVKINFISTGLMHRFAEFIIALLENTFATISVHNVIMRGDIIINLQEKNSDTFAINYNYDGIDTYTITLGSFATYDDNVENHHTINATLFKLLTNILANNFIYMNFEKTLNALLGDEHAFERSLNHTNSLYNLNGLIELEEKIDVPVQKILRTKEWYSGIKIESIEEEKVDPFKDKESIKFGKLEHNPMNNMSHQNMYTSEIIKVSHWDVAKWRGAIYLTKEDNSLVIGFIFENNDGAKMVFKDLIDKVSHNDANGCIIISIIKGINKERKYDYRVMIAEKLKIPVNTNGNYVVKSFARFNNMNCENDNSIRFLEEKIRNRKSSISIIPVIINNNKYNFLWDYEIKIKGINIKNAYEVGKSDIEAMAIKANDNPIIPTDIKNAPIKDLLEMKK